MPLLIRFDTVPDSMVHGANMGPIWGRQDPGGPHVDPMNFAIWGDLETPFTYGSRIEIDLQGMKNSTVWI